MRMAVLRRAVFVLLLAVSASVAGEPERKLLDEVIEVIRTRFYDRPRYHDVDLAKLAAEFGPRADKTDAKGWRPLLTEMLARFRASHLTLLEPEIYAALRAELAGKSAPSLGMTVEQVAAGQFFVRSVAAGGPAAKAGLLRGDRLVRIGKAPPALSPYLVPAGGDPGLGGTPLFVLSAERGPATLVVQRQARPSRLQSIRVTPAPWGGRRTLEASAKVLQRGGYSMGYVAVPSCHRGAGRRVAELMTDKFGPCHGLILDLRGRGGWANVANDLLDLFRGRQARAVLARRRLPPLWIKPVVFLIDGRSRSAKELMAHQIRRLRLGPLVGERTEGALLAAGFFTLSDGRTLEVPILEYRVNGVQIEGVGVAPNISVQAPLRYARGRDPILEAGLVELLARVRAAALETSDHTVR